MAVNEITLQKAAQIQRLDPANTRFFMKNGFLAMTYTGEEGEKTHDRVFLHRDFPFELLWSYISVMGEDSKDPLGRGNVKLHHLCAAAGTGVLHRNGHMTVCNREIAVCKFGIGQAMAEGIADCLACFVIIAIANIDTFPIFRIFLAEGILGDHILIG